MRRGGNWLSGFQHLSYSRRGESRASTARFHVWKCCIEKKTQFMGVGFVGQNSTCVWFVLCVVIRIVKLIRPSDRSLTLNWYPHLAPQCELSMAMQSPALDTHALILSRQKFQMSELQLCKHGVYWQRRWWGLRMGSGLCQGDRQHLIITADNTETLSDKLSQQSQSMIALLLLIQLAPGGGHE